MSDRMSIHMFASRVVGDDTEEVKTVLCLVPTNKDTMINAIVRFQERAMELFDDGKLGEYPVKNE